MPRQAIGSESLPFRGFAAPTSNTTYCPNQFFDVCLPNASRGCLRLVAYLLRKTLGWSDEQGRPQAERHRVTYQELVTKAGISRDMIRSAIDEAISAHFIVQVQLGRPNSAGLAAVSSLYELKWDDRTEYIKAPKQFRGFFAGEGNRTYIPNQFFDVVVPHEALAVVKVVGSVIRFSIGFQNRWGHRRRVIALSYQSIQNYVHIGNRSTLSSAIRVAMQRNYLQRVEDGIFDRDHAASSRPATYALMWLNQATGGWNGQKNGPGKSDANERSEIQTENGRKNGPDQRSEKRTDIQITETNNTLKQQRRRAEVIARSPTADRTAVAFKRLREAGFDTSAARTMASKYPLDQIDRQLGWIGQRRVRSNRLGMLRSAIEHDWSAPNVSGRQLGRPNFAERDRGATFADALQQAQRRLTHDQPSSQPHEHHHQH